MNTYRITFFIGLLLLGSSLPVLGQTSPDPPPVQPTVGEWPQSTFSAGIYYSTLGPTANPINLTFEKLMLTKGGHRWGYSFGYSMLLAGYVSNRMGAHAALGYIRKQGVEERHHLEFHAGMAMFVWEYYDGAIRTNPLPFPVLALGYRHQRPGAPSFFRLGVNLGGIAIGFGYVIGQKP